VNASLPCTSPLGGGTIKGISKPGEIVWSHVFLESGKLKADAGRATVVDLNREEVERRWVAQRLKGLMNAVLYGVARESLMARHRLNHIQVAYGKDATSADKAMFAKPIAFGELGIDVYVCGSQIS